MRPGLLFRLHTQRVNRSALQAVLAEDSVRGEAVFEGACAAGVASAAHFEVMIRHAATTEQV